MKGRHVERELVGRMRPIPELPSGRRFGFEVIAAGEEDDARSRGTRMSSSNRVGMRRARTAPHNVCRRRRQPQPDVGLNLDAGEVVVFHLDPT